MVGRQKSPEGGESLGQSRSRVSKGEAGQGRGSSLNYFCGLQAGGVVPGGLVFSPGMFKAEKCRLLYARTS